MNDYKVVVRCTPSTEDEGNTNTEFFVKCQYGIELQWQVKRSAEDFQSLCDALSRENNAFAFHNVDEVTTTAVATYLNYVIDICRNEFWLINCIQNFLDDCPNQSIMSKIRTDKLSNEVRHMNERLRATESKLLDFEHRTAHIIDVLLKERRRGEELPPLTQQNLEQYTVSISPKKRSELKSNPNSRNGSRNNSFNKLSFNSAPTSQSAVSNIASYGSIFQTHIPEVADEYIASSSDDDEASVYSAARSINSTTMEGALSPSKQRLIRRQAQLSLMHSSNPSSDQSMNATLAGMESPNGKPPVHMSGQSTPSSNRSMLIPPGDPIQPSTAVRGALLDQHDSSESIPGVSSVPRPIDEETAGPILESERMLKLPNFKVLRPDLIPTNETGSLLMSAADEIINAIQPHEEQIQFRNSVVGLIRRQTRRALCSNAFEIGFHEIRCFLPEDPIKLSVVVSKSRLSDWHKTLMEQLNATTEKMLSNALDEEHDSDMIEEFRPIAQHAFSNISFASFNLNFKVLLNVDHVDAEVTSNGRADLVLLSFFEEVARLVGKDHLFKRSMLLIRAWWCYETSAAVGSSIKHYLSDFSIAIMICAVFNKYHRNMSSPFQALCIFVAEYADYDGSTSAITLQGIVPFKSETSNQPVLKNTQNGALLIPAAMIEHYWQVFNIGKLSEENEEAPPILSIASSSSDVSNTNPSYHVASNQSATLTPHMKTATAAAAIKAFDRYAFNIVHPFLLTNMLTEKISIRRVSKLSKAFHSGAKMLTTILEQPCNNISMARTHVKSIFSAVIAKFGSGWRPDTVTNQIVLNNETSMEHLFQQLTLPSMDRILQNIQYFDLVLESVVSEFALLTISFEILADKGPLPVGEIGKVLTELSSNPNLSLKLKESFGGLKKFLEKYPDKFVIVSDHPFNPHVMLRQTLTPQQLDMISKGILPPQLSAKTKKGANSKKKTKASPREHSASYYNLNVAQMDNINIPPNYARLTSQNLMNNPIVLLNQPRPLTPTKPSQAQQQQQQQHGNHSYSPTHNVTLADIAGMNAPGCVGNNKHGGSNNLASIGGLMGRGGNDYSNAGLYQSGNGNQPGMQQNLMHSNSTEMTFDTGYSSTTVNSQHALLNGRPHSFHGTATDSNLASSQYSRQMNPRGVLSSNSNNLMVGASFARGGPIRSNSLNKSDSDLLSSLNSESHLSMMSQLRSDSSDYLHGDVLTNLAPLSNAYSSMQQQQHHHPQQQQQSHHHQQQQQQHQQSQNYSMQQPMMDNEYVHYSNAVNSNMNVKNSNNPNNHQHNNPYPMTQADLYNAFSARDLQHAQRTNMNNSGSSSNNNSHNNSNNNLNNLRRPGSNYELDLNIDTGSININSNNNNSHNSMSNYTGLFSSKNNDKLSFLNDTQNWC